MGWEKHKDSPNGKYYTRTTRVGKRRIRQYFGAGPLGELAWLDDTLRRVEKEILRQQLRGNGKPKQVEPNGVSHG